MRITANNGHPGQCRALLGPHNMNNTLAVVGQIDQRDTETIAVAIEGFQLQPAGGIVYPRVTRHGSLGGVSRYIVIGNRDIGTNPMWCPTGDFESLKRLW